ADDRATLYYSELLMDAGCTAWAGFAATAIMGDELEARRDFYFFTDARNPFDGFGWLQQYMAPGAPVHVRARRILDFSIHGKAFDPRLVEAFDALAQDPSFWEAFEEERVWEMVLSMEPHSPQRFFPKERLADVAAAFADFADLKSFYAAGHSRRVGDLAAGM